MCLQVGRDFLCGSFRNGSAVYLHHFVDFRFPGCSWQRWLHNDVPCAVTSRTETLRFQLSFPFSQLRSEKPIRPHIVLRIWCQLWRRSLLNARSIRGTVRPASHLCEKQATGERRRYSYRNKRHLPSFLHRRSPQFAFPATSSCFSILFHKYPPAFQTVSSGCTFPFSSVALTVIEYFPGVFGVHGASQLRKE